MRFRLTVDPPSKAEVIAAQLVLHSPGGAPEEFKRQARNILTMAAMDRLRVGFVSSSRVQS